MIKSFLAVREVKSHFAMVQAVRAGSATVHCRLRTGRDAAHPAAQKSGRLR
jgi:hypothetical protein